MNVKRYDPVITLGLTDQQIHSRLQDGLINFDSAIPTKTIKQIVKDNFITLFNILNLALALALICVGSYKNTLFIGVVISNIIIGTYQEIIAKKTIDKLSIISSTKVKVVRNGKETLINTNEIVLDDIVILEQGNQITTDCIIIDGKCLVNESLITGESDPIRKGPHDTLLSGSYISGGKCYAKVEHVGFDNYASKISQDAKYIKKTNSEIMFTFKKIILTISMLIVPIGIYLFTKQISLPGNSLQLSVEKTVAALIGMIPEGLVLLTSSVLAVSVIRLSKHKVMVQDLYCIETLARVDVLCLDKTGTITEGSMEVTDILCNNSHSIEEINDALSTLTAVLDDNNPTFNAIKQKYPGKPNCKAITVFPFSSENKWSGASFEGGQSFAMGAAEFMLQDIQIKKISDSLTSLSSKGRVLTIIKCSSPLGESTIPDNAEILGFVLIKDKIRSTAKGTLDFFNKQDVDIKIISGDNPLTVFNIAKTAGLKNADKFVDASLLQSESEITEAAKKYSVFGRVSPSQKKQLIKAFKDQGHTVAMTGDGVNDVLALKEADCSIAMASGSDAARNVSQLVLLNSNFDAMIKVVKEGRRSINNIQRSSSLFLVKTIYSTLLAITFLFINMQYPFSPIQMTLPSIFTIGIPSFILALEPNSERIKGHFLINVLTRAIPGAFTIVINIILIMTMKVIFDMSSDQSSTLSVFLTIASGLMLLSQVCKPFNLLRKIVFGSICLCVLACITFFNSFFSLTHLTSTSTIIFVSLLTLSFFIYRTLIYFFEIPTNTYSK